MQPFHIFGCGSRICKSMLFFVKLNPGDGDNNLGVLVSDNDSHCTDDILQILPILTKEKKSEQNT